MRKGILGSIAALTAGAGMAFGQGPSRGMAPPAPIMPSGVYDGGPQQASFRGSPADIVPPPTGAPVLNGIPQQGDPSGGLMPGGGLPTYPQPGTYGGSPYPDAGAGCAPQGRGVPNFWFHGEYLLWFIESQRVVNPLVTTSAPGDNGLPGLPTTQTLFSPRDISYGATSGFRLSGGWWRDCDKRCGFEIVGFLMEHKSAIFEASSDDNGIPTLARPFFQASGGPAVYLVSNLGLASGSLVVATSSRAYGVEANGVINLYRDCPDNCRNWNIDMIGGFRFFQLREDLNIDTTSTILNGGATFVGQPITVGSQVLVRDSFDTFNQFYGGQLGIRGSHDCGRWTFSAFGKCAVGVMHQSVDVNGITTLRDTALNLNATAQGGVLATRDNIGNYKNDEFAILPEVGATLAYNWTNWFSTYVGYNGLYANRVVRPGNSLPAAVNPSLMPSSNNFGIGAVTPTLNTSLTQTEFWIQGVTFGFNVRF